MFPECECEICGRRFRHNYRQGHTRRRCNSCRSNTRLVPELKARLVALKGGGCEICGYDRCQRALTFHHLDPATKRFNIAGSHNRSWEALTEEARRCVLLCEKCHREVESGITEIPTRVRTAIEAELRGVERRERRRPGRPRAA